MGEQLRLFEEKPMVDFAETAWADPTRMWRTADNFITYNPSILVTRKGLDIFDKMRQDDQIKAALSFKKHAILSTGWEVVSPEGKARDWEVTEFVWWALEHIEETFEEALFGILSAMDFGFAVSEKIWSAGTTSSSKTFGGKDHVILKALKAKKPHSFDFETDSYGNLRKLIQIQDQGRVSLPLDKFVVFTYEKEFGNFYGKSDLEAAYRPWWAKHNVYQWLVMYLERLGIPPVFALYDPNSYSPTQKNDLKDIMINMQAATFGIMPRPNKPNASADQILDFWSPELASQAKDVFLPALDMFNQDIARAVLMPGLIGFTPDIREGSYARSKKHFDVFMMVVEYIRRKLEKRVVFEQITKPIVDLNFSVDDYPIFKFLPMTEEVRADLLDRWIQAIDKGIVVSQPEDEIHIRTLLRFPEKDDLANPAQPIDNKDKSDKNTPPDKVVSDSASKDKKVYSDSKSNVQYMLAALEEQAFKDFQDIFTKMQDSLYSFIVKNWDTRQKWVNDLKVKYFQEVQEVLREVIRVSFTKGKLSVSNFDTFSIDSLKWVSQKALVVSNDLRDRILTVARLSVTNSINNGKSKEEAVREIKGFFNAILSYKGSSSKIGLFLNLTVSEAYNQGVIAEARVLGESKIKGIRYVSVSDEATSSVCSLLSNKIFKLDDPDLIRLAPPNSYNCRSYLRPVFVNEPTAVDEEVTESIKGQVKDSLMPIFGGIPK